jgi:tetratricopeptide (TPR) repeat protein
VRKGQRVGRYTLLEVIGQGGMGVVARAQREDGREVALKLLPALSSSDHRLERFRREGVALVRLRHPHVVHVHEVGEDQGRAFLAMDLVPGSSLEERLGRGEPLRPREAARLLRELAQAVAHAHAEGILHRDLKPANVIVTPEGKAVLVDFGLAGLLDESAEERLTRSGAFLGTPGYWPPEQARGQRDRIGPHSDVYGLGATLYAALTGGPPQQGEALELVAGAAQRATPPSELRADVDPVLEAICLRCLEPAPEDRYPDAAALDQALADYLRRAESPQAPSTRPALWAGALLLVAVVAALVILAGGRRPGSPVAAQPASPTEAPGGTLEAAQALELAATGDERLLAGQAEGAIEAYDQALELDPECAAAWAGRGYAYGMRGEREPALASCERAVELDPELGMAWSHYAGVVEHMLGELERALTLHDRALTLNRGDGWIWRRRSACRVKLGDLGGGLEDLGQAIDLDPNDTAARGDRAYLRSRGGDLEGAVADYTALLELEPGRVAVWEERSRLRQRLGQVEQALRELDQGLELNPQSWSLYNARGFARLAILQDARGAVADFDKALAIDPAYVTAWINRASAKASLGDEEGSLADYAQALELDPEDRRAWSNRGAYHAQRGRYEAGVADLSRAIELDPRDARSWDMRGVAHSKLGRLEAAAADYERSLELAPTVAQTWRNRALLHTRREDWASAISDLDRCLQLEPRLANAWSDRGYAKHHAGDLQGALDDYAQALQLNPRYAGVLADRGRVRETLGDLEGALEDYGGALTLRPQRGEWLALRGLLRARLGRPGAREDLEASLAVEPGHSLAGEAKRVLAGD